MNYLNNLLILILMISCSSNLENANDVKYNNLSNRVLDQIIKEDSILEYSFSNEMHFHIGILKLSQQHYRLNITFNQLVPSKNDDKIFNVIAFNKNKIKSYIYMPKSNTYNYPNAFFVPDASSWEYLIHEIGGELEIYKMIFIPKEVPLNFDEKEEGMF